MKEDKDILKQVSHSDGMKVPDGYFADFAARMADSLPTTSFELSADPSVPAAPRTFWQRVRPYVYMAAMFAGVWCMLKMFTMLTTPPDTGWELSPVMAEAMNNEIFVDEYIIDNVDEMDLMEDMFNDGFDLTSLNMPSEAEATAEGEDNTVSI